MNMTEGAEIAGQASSQTLEEVGKGDALIVFQFTLVQIYYTAQSIVLG